LGMERREGDAGAEIARSPGAERSGVMVDLQMRLDWSCQRSQVSIDVKDWSTA
jgi:hypothetical protein